VAALIPRRPHTKAIGNRGCIGAPPILSRSIKPARQGFPLFHIQLKENIEMAKDPSGVPGLNDGKNADAYEPPAQGDSDTSFLNSVGNTPRFPKSIEKQIDANLGQSKKSGC
jgi:hypothetical protein